MRGPRGDTGARGVTAGPGPWALGLQSSEVIAEVRVHGNHISSDEEVLKIAAITIGQPFGATTIADVTKRLKDARKFETIEVLKRFASIEDPSKISLVIIVNEGAVRIELPQIPGGEVRITRRAWYRNLMYMPILDGEDGYGFTYGVRIAYPGLIGGRSRLSTPLTWGGFRRAGVEVDRTFERGPLSRIELGSAIQQQKNPAYQEKDDRTRVWGRAERALGDVRLAGTGGWQRVSFGDLDHDVPTVGFEAAYDTRLDPVLPRNAVYAAATVERLFFDAGPATTQTRLDARGYLGVFRQNVVVVRAVREDATEPLPPYLKSLLGGWSSLRGFRAGSVRRRHDGDRLARAAHAALVATERRQARAQRLRGHRQGLRQSREVRRSAVSHRHRRGRLAHPHRVSHGPYRRPRPRRRHAGEFRSGDHVLACWVRCRC